MRSLILFGLLCLVFVDFAISLDQEQDCKCRIQSKKRIVGGREADPVAYPWQVSLQNKELRPVPDNLRKLVPENEKIDYPFCGASIISNSWVITAAHCVFGKSASDLLVAYGDNDLVKMFEQKKYAQIDSYFIYPGYNDWRLHNDIALIKLKTPLNFTYSVQPACLPVQHQHYYDGVLTISGFGSVENLIEDRNGNTIHKGRYIRYLKEGTTYDRSKDHGVKCRIGDNICTENLIDSSPVNSCMGDSGGPLHYTFRGRTTVIGLTSTGEDKKDPHTGNDILCSGVDYYTRISTYIHWINKYISGNNLCF